MQKEIYTNFDDLPLVLSVPQVGKILGISRARAYELVRAKGFPSIHVGTRILVPKESLMGWLREKAEGLQ